ncbi:hypothetical protein FQA39_LY12870 [Lamprigera yunnana]|nr:hypothetical protein FQA39_LY12870 [Lamprigera yunnana]
MIKMTEYEGEILGITLPDKVELVISEAEAAVKGDTTSGALKRAKLETGLEIMVPLFVEEGTKVLVSTIDVKLTLDEPNSISEVDETIIYKAIEQKAKNRLKENLEIPGFRKGKAPANEIEKYMTPSKIFNEGFRIMVGTAFEFAQDQNPKVEPMSSPDPKPVKVSEKELVIEFSFDLRPEIKLGKYKGITTIAKQTLEVTKEEIDSVLTTYQNSICNGKAKPETGKIESGDIVTFDFKGFV